MYGFLFEKAFTGPVSITTITVYTLCHGETVIPLGFLHAAGWQYRLNVKRDVHVLHLTASFALLLSVGVL